MKLIIDNVYTQIQYEEGKQFEKYFDDILHSNIDPLDPNRYMKSAYRKHYWDGRITVYNVQNKVFPTGLVGDVIELIKQTQKSYPLVRMDIQDVRGLPIGAKNIPDTITLKDTPKGDLILDPNDPIRGYQYDAVKFCIEEQRGFVGAATGSGKATYDETLIPMADGSQKKVKDINIGDFLIGQNGKPTKVLAKYPQPIKELYKVSLLDGRKFIVCDEHLMPVYTRNQRTAKTIDNLKVKPLKSIMDDYKQVYIDKFGSKHNQYKYSIPQADSVTYTEVKHVISPYTLGVLLAEGSLNDINKIKNITISTNEQDILNKFMKDSGLIKYTHTGKNYGYNFSQKNNDKVLPICNEILRLNLAHTTKDKFIPTEYLIDSIDNRLALLRGLIDTDGYISSSKDRTNYNVSFSTSSEKMLSTFLSLIDSLGFGRTVHIDTHKETGTNYDINIFTPMKIWSSKKHEQQAHGLVYKSNKDRYTPIVNIESVGYKPSTCFTVDNKDKLFLINDYVVTHNTIIAEALIQLDLKSINKNDKILFIVHNKIIAYQTKKRFEESLHIPIGFWGDGQKDIQQVTVCLVGTIASGLKKPEDSVKLTSNKDKVLKAMVTKYIPKLESYPNIKVVVKNFIKNNQPQYAYEEPVWEAFSDMVQPNMKDKDILKIFDSYKKQYDKLLKKKASKVYDKYHSTKDILDSVRVVIVDECLTGDTLITLNDSTQKPIKDIKVGDTLYGNNKVLHTLTMDKQPVVRIRHAHGMLESSETHPLAVLRDSKMLWLPVMKIEESDSLLVPISHKHINMGTNTLDERIARFVGLIIADGHILKGHKHIDGNFYRSNTVRVNVSKDFEWYRTIFIDGIHAIEKKIAKSVAITDKLDSRGNLLLRVTDKDVLDYLDRFNIPFGKKSSVVTTPTVYKNNDTLLANMYSTIISCEGDTNINRFGSTRLNFNMCSKQLMLEMQNWFLFHNITSNFAHMCGNKGHSSVYRISFGGKNYNTLVESMPIIKRKVLSKNKGEEKDHFYKGYLISKIRHIEHDLPEQVLYDLTTENSTFIANGVLSHNCHHASSNQYQTVMNSLPNARQRIGLSGSISQSDDVKWTALKSVISDKIFKISNKQMIDSGVSAKPYIQFIPIDEPKNLDEQVKDSLPANLDENNQALLVYQEAYRQGIIENDYRNMIIVQLLKKLYETDKTALVVVSSIEHGETLQSMLKTMKIPSAFLRGDVPMSDRQEIIDNIKAGKSKIVFGTSVVNEGMDIPSLKYLVYASAGKASTPVLQRVGRVLRKSSDKDTALIFDFSDNMSKVLYKQSMERKMIYTKEGFQLIDK